MKTKPLPKNKDVGWGEDLYHITREFPLPLGKVVTTLCGLRLPTRRRTSQIECVVCKELA